MNCSCGRGGTGDGVGVGGAAAAAAHQQVLLALPAGGLAPEGGKQERALERARLVC